MAGVSCYILADTFFAARGVGEAGLAALNIAVPVYSFIICGKTYARTDNNGLRGFALVVPMAFLWLIFGR